MTFVTTHFEQPGMQSDYTRLYKVFEYSVRLNVPTAKLVNLTVEPKQVPRGLTASLQANHDKMLAWAEFVDTADDDLVLIDCDMLVMRDFQDVFDRRDFDIALTARKTARIPINGGVVLVRNTEAGYDFIRRWAEADTELYNDRALHQFWRGKFRGMNQASLGMLRDKAGYDADVIELPCQYYNAVDTTWHSVTTDEPYAIHCKSNMKRQVLSTTPLAKMRESYRPVAQIWRGYEQALLAER